MFDPQPVLQESLPSHLPTLPSSAFAFPTAADAPAAAEASPPTEADLGSGKSSQAEGVRSPEDLDTIYIYIYYILKNIWKGIRKDPYFLSQIVFIYTVCCVYIYINIYIYVLRFSV